jgi:hypothetical protein
MMVIMMVTQTADSREQTAESRQQTADREQTGYCHRHHRSQHQRGDERYTIIQ